MKKSIFLIIALYFALTATNAQEVKDTSLVITFENTTHDYGTITQGSDGHYEFTFTNGGKTPLVLSDVRSSCGCTVPVWTKDPIQPKGKGSIKVQYNTANVGTFQKSITVISNAKNSPIILTIKGNVIAKQ